MFRSIALLLCLVGPTPMFAQAIGGSSPMAPDLALVPADSFLVAHVKLAELWNNDALKDVRMIYAKAGADMIATFNKRFVPMLSTVDRLTIYVHHPDFDNGPEGMRFVGILTLTENIDQKKFLAQFAEKTVTKKGKFANYVTDEDGFLAIRFVSPKIIAFGMAEAIQEMCDTEKIATTGPQKVTLDRANGSKDPVTLGVSFDSIPEEARKELLKELPEPLHPLVQASSMTLSMDLIDDGHLHLMVSYPDADATDKAEKAIAAASNMALDLIKDLKKQLIEKVTGDGKPGKIEDLPEAAASLLGLGALTHAEDIIKAKPVKRKDLTLTLSQPLPPQFKSVLGAGALGASMLAPAVGKLRMAAMRAQGQNNLKQIGLAIHNYHDANNAFPPAAIVDKKGKPLLSWRVAILPYIEQDNLYRQFKLDEPWDSEHNLKISQTNIKTYMLPNMKYDKPGQTNYRVFYNNGAMFDWIKGNGFASVTDGLSNTWMVVESAEPTNWAKPDDFEFDPKKELPKLNDRFQGGFNVVFGDGSVRYYKKVPKAAKELITRGGGEVVPEE